MAVITKTDLAAAAEFDAAAAHRSIQAVRPGMEIFEVSAKTGQGMGRGWPFSNRKKGSGVNGADLMRKSLHFWHLRLWTWAVSVRPCLRDAG